MMKYAFAVVLCLGISLAAKAGPKGGVIRAPRVPDQQTAVNGNLKEWQTSLLTDKQKIVLTRDTGNVHVGTVDSDRDFSATVYALYDSGNLYVAAQVTDDATEKGFGNGENWRNDCIEIWIDGANDGGTMPDLGGPDPDNYQFNVDVNGLPWVYRNNEAAKILGQLKSAAVLEGTNYTLEARIPFAAIPEFKFKPDAVIGFSVSFVDSDKGVWNHILWQGDVEHNPEQWGDLVFSSESLAVEPRAKVATAWARIKTGE